jgi:pyridoxal phosphate enzyme (YggS family)
LQRNKAKIVAPVASVVHTIDSQRLAEELGKRAVKALPVLVEVNVGGEDQKSGCRAADLATVLEAVERESALRLTGLMTVPPLSDEPEASRRSFEELVVLRDAHGGPSRLPELSMGMSHDLEEAIRAGATIVRVGTAIFGARS